MSQMVRIAPKVKAGWGLWLIPTCGRASLQTHYYFPSSKFEKRQREQEAKTKQLDCKHGTKSPVFWAALISRQQGMWWRPSQRRPGSPALISSDIKGIEPRLLLSYAVSTCFRLKWRNLERERWPFIKGPRQGVLSPRCLIFPSHRDTHPLSLYPHRDVFFFLPGGCCPLSFLLRSLFIPTNPIVVWGAALFLGQLSNSFMLTKSSSVCFFFPISSYE